jgi:xanthine dehydrogenase accessory factor
MNNWLPVLQERLRDETALIRVVVATVRGSAPREAGACMLIGSERVDGSIGGGQLELKATEIARGMLLQPDQAARLDRFALGATLGQCCGGAVNLWFERFDANDQAFVDHALDAQRAGGPAVMVTLPHAGAGINRSLHTRDAGPQLLADIAGAPVAAAVDELLGAAPDAPPALLVRMDRREALLERIDAKGLPLWLFGAGHVGKALIRVMEELPFHVTWIDSREDAFPQAVPANTRVRHCDAPAALVDDAPAGACFLVLTHSHDLDYEICRAILRRDDFAWAGLIGSETKAACFNLRFGRENIAADRVARLVSPIGIGGIDSKLPAAIAVSVAAQLLQIAGAAAQSHALPAMTITKGARNP